ncbi:MAG TPA: helix-turn-helix domain-containing protein, partial [Planctomycetota bacterium]|nr:helix-turn-helix domain-containing protein [Planctomycetota bacterium]
DIDLSRPLREVRELHSRDAERRYLEAVLRHHQGNVTAAARTAGVERPHFYRLLWRHGLK